MYQKDLKRAVKINQQHSDYSKTQRQKSKDCHTTYIKQNKQKEWDVPTITQPHLILNIEQDGIFFGMIPLQCSQ
uniref:Uncharacterized protein n=1 Tax=Timema poppense TaxID=170557 RepID=A0A7R9DP39_TIMPO|nr:unnamed protein product [Timema poppensis]